VAAFGSLADANSVQDALAAIKAHDAGPAGPVQGFSVISISVDTDEESWVVGGQRRSTDMGYLMLKPSEVRELSVLALREAFESYVERLGHTEEAVAVVYNGGGEGYFDVDAPYRQVEFLYLDGQVAIRIEHIADWPADDDLATLRGSLWATTEALVSRRGARIVSLSDEDQFWQDSGAPDLAIFTMCFALPRDMTHLDEALALGDDLVRLIDAFVGESPTRDTLADLIRGGNAHLLVGQPEGPWLDAKSQEWDLGTKDGKHRLAIEVAAFCNAEDGGIIVVGATTKTPVPGGGEIITAVGGLDRVKTQPRAYMQILSHKVFPLPFGLQVLQVALPGGTPLLLIDIPKQPEELKPFLVSGGVSADGAKVEARAFTVVQRRGEDTAHLEAAMLHAQLAAGRALLRGDYSSGDR
jgi:hypothetical protein